MGFKGLGFRVYGVQGGLGKIVRHRWLLIVP